MEALNKNEREVIQDLPQGWKLKYFEPDDPDYDVEYENGPYSLRLHQSGIDYNLLMLKGDYIEENLNIADLDKANQYAIELMRSVSDLKLTEVIRHIVRESLREKNQRAK